MHGKALVKLNLSQQTMRGNRKNLKGQFIFQKLLTKESVLLKKI